MQPLGSLPRANYTGLLLLSKKEWHAFYIRMNDTKVFDTLKSQSSEATADCMDFLRPWAGVIEEGLSLPIFAQAHFPQIDTSMVTGRCHLFVVASQLPCLLYRPEGHAVHLLSKPLSANLLFPLLDHPWLQPLLGPGQPRPFPKGQDPMDPASLLPMGTTITTTPSKGLGSLYGSSSPPSRNSLWPSKSCGRLPAPPPVPRVRALVGTVTPDGAPGVHTRMSEVSKPRSKAYLPSSVVW